MNKASYILGVCLLLIGVAAYLFSDSGGWLQALGLILVVSGIVFAALGLFYPLKRKPSQPFTLAPPPPSTPAQPAPKSTVGKDPAIRLEGLQKLLDHDLISKEDYEKKREEILSQI